MKKIFAVIYNGRDVNTPVCFPEMEWAMSYREYMSKQLGIGKRLMFHIANKAPYIIKELEYCEHPPTLSMTGSTEQ